MAGDDLPLAAADEISEEGLEGGAGGGCVVEGGVAEFAEGELVLMEGFADGFELEGQGGGLGWNLVVELGLVTELRNFYFVFYQWFARAGALTGKIDLR